MSERVILFPALPENPCDECRHRGRETWEEYVLRLGREAMEDLG